jgi:filamin
MHSGPSFAVEMADAGDGTIEISIAGPNGQLIPNEVITTSTSLLEVHFIPAMPGSHRVSVAYNGSPIPGKI